MFDIGRRKEERQLKEEAWHILGELELQRVAFRPVRRPALRHLKRIELARAWRPNPSC
jgi:ABC-type branched-subunit amino acid transport system ATPase component